MHYRLGPLAIGAALLLNACSTNSPRPDGADRIELPGRQADGAILLPNQWSLRPVGRQTALGDFPLNMAVDPSDKFVAVLHCGYGQQEVRVIEIDSGRLVSSVGLEESFYGLAFSPDGGKLFVSGAGQEAVHRYEFHDGYLGRHSIIRLRDRRLRAVPAGMAVTPDGQRLYVANVWGHRVSEVDLTSELRLEDIAIGTNDLLWVEGGPKKQVAADLNAILKRAEADLDPTVSADPFPYTCVVDEKRDRLYVSLWAQAAIAVVDLKERKVVVRWLTDEHPNEMLLTKSGQYLYVACANQNTVAVFDTTNGRQVETLVAELVPNSPPGSTPNSLALTPDEKLLFVANANINAVAVYDVSQVGRSRSLGFIPVGWYPTSVRVTHDGKKLLVANGKGLTSKPNRHGPQPGQEMPGTVAEYIAGLFKGTLSVIPLPKREKLDAQMEKHTAQAYRCMPRWSADGQGQVNATGGEEGNRASKGRALAAGRPEWDNPVPLKAGGPTPIKYCIYIIKENRTYDQVLGDMREGNGDPSLCLFPERVTPNHHALAREFVLLDNFYVEGEVSADGHEWTVGAYASDFVEKTWPMTYGHNKSKKFPYPSEGNFHVAAPAGGYLWDRAREAGVSYRSYGEFIANGPGTNAPCVARVAALEGHFDPWYRSFDMDHSDLARADRFTSELRRFEREGDMPRLQIVRLPNDHTAGTVTNKPTPTAYVAENDLAFGRVIEAITRSRFWPQTAVFVVEDDAQNGPDHVDAHRSIAYVISPYARRDVVDSTMYSTASMLRTMELVLGLKPMSQFDALARPMFRSFQSRPTLRPYRCKPANIDLNERNTALAWGADLSRQMDFSKEDAADDLQLNEVIWRSVRGPDSPMPAPRRAAFVITRGEED
jgi:DNA-binding beta-propeller fold protein YncE